MRFIYLLTPLSVLACADVEVGDLDSTGGDADEAAEAAVIDDDAVAHHGSGVRGTQINRFHLANGDTVDVPVDLSATAFEAITDCGDDTQVFTGQGFADVRMFATRRQVLMSLVTLVCVRPLSIAWRGNAGQHPLGQA
jgi:hypothetical protein